ncbi:MAG: hypothetical protein DWQ02_07500 [Bacteroidetes bacterium]|nr:MAG: hypothetical protein DWQ02_07500 [Bacteroidota bacterium]
MKLQSLFFLCTFLPIISFAQKSQINFWEFSPEAVVITYRTYLDKKVIKESSVTIPKVSSNSFELDGEPVYILNDTIAQFPGGHVKALNFVMENMKWPQKWRNWCISYSAYVCFIVEKSGEITHIGLMRQGIYDLDINAMKVISEMPNWIPAKIDGNNVRSIFIFPMRFRLE